MLVVDLRREEEEIENLKQLQTRHKGNAYLTHLPINNANWKERETERDQK